MSFTELLAKLKRYDEGAAVIFDRHEPIGRPTDLVLPEPRWSLFRRQSPKIVSASPNETPSGPRA